MKDQTDLVHIENVTLEEEHESFFQWNLVGWFSSSLGAALWLMLTPFFLSWPAKGVFAGIVATLLVWSFSAIAWAFREKFSAFQGIVGLLCTTVLASFGFLLFAHAHELPLNEGVSNLESNYGTYYATVLLAFLSLTLYFWIKEFKSPR